MSSPNQSLFVVLWALVVTAEGSLMLLLLWRKAWHDNGAFTSFITFCVMRSFLMLYIQRASMNPAAPYLALRWGLYAVQFVLLIAVVLEVVKIIFRPYDALPRGTLGNFVLATLTVASLAVMFTVRFPGAHPSEWLMILRAVDQGLSWALWGIFAIFVLFSACLGIPWNHRVYGIVAGFFFYLSVDVAVATMTVQFGLRGNNYIWLLDMVAFMGACSVWTYSFAHAEVPRSVPTMEEVSRIMAVLGQYVVLIESLEVKRPPSGQPHGASQWNLNLGGGRDAQ
jgi:hypothetical protein